MDINIIDYSYIRFFFHYILIYIFYNILEKLNLLNESYFFDGIDNILILIIYLIIYFIANIMIIKYFKSKLSKQ